MKTSTRLLSPAATMIVLVLAPAVVRAQFAPGMDGRANDANNQIGSGGINAPVQNNFFNAGNLFVTGNVTRGRAFRGFSPISDPSALRVSLPTASISNFRRDSIGMSQVTNNQAFYQTNPFFDRTQTVAGLGAIQSGLTVPGSSVLQSTTVVPVPSQYRNPMSTRYPYSTPLDGSLPNEVVPNSSIYTPQNLPLIQDLYGYVSDRDVLQALRESPVFGRATQETRPLSRIGDTPYSGTVDPYAFDPDRFRSRPADPIRRQPRSLESDRRQRTSEGMFTSARELVSPTQVAPKLFGSAFAELQRDSLTGRPVDRSGGAHTGGAEPAIDPVTGQPTSRFASRDRVAQAAPSLLDRRESNMARSYQVVDPQADPLRALSRAVTTVMEYQDVAVEPDQPPGLPPEYEQALEVISSVPDVPVASFAGDTATRVNDLIIRAETQMREGNYFTAARHYALAVAFDPSNALLRFGYGHALLAAGEYLTAAHELSVAIDNYPAIGFLEFDLAGFVNDPDILDIRRADLEDILSRNDDYRLRFLLGYTEYFSNLPQFGIENLKRAAENAPDGSDIKRFPELLELPEKLRSPQDKNE